MLKIGDTVECHDADDAIETLRPLAREGYDVEFIYEKDGREGIWILITDAPRAAGCRATPEKKQKNSPLNNSVRHPGAHGRQVI